MTLQRKSKQELVVIGLALLLLSIVCLLNRDFTETLKDRQINEEGSPIHVI